jgi:hypothetical protein
VFRKLDAVAVLTARLLPAPPPGGEMAAADPERPGTALTWVIRCV